MPKKSIHQKEVIIKRDPKILIISLQRIGPSIQIKNKCYVDFPLLLDLKDFVDKDLNFNRESRYNLYSVINHYGVVNFGYYNSFIKIEKNKKWYCFDDSNVNLIGNELTNKNNDIFWLIYEIFF